MASIRRVKSLETQDDFLNERYNHVDLSNKIMLKVLFYQVDWVYILVDLVAKEFASVTPLVYSKSIVDGQETYEQNDAHPVKAILDNPQDDRDPNTFYYSIAADLILGGDSFAWFARGHKKFTFIPNQYVMIYADKYVANLAKTIDISKQDMLRLKFPSLTFDTAYGLSPFVAGYGAVQFSKDCQDYLNAYFRKGALPQVILETEVAGNLETLKILKRTFDNEYMGKGKQRNTLVLPKGIKANVLDNKIADQQITQLMEYNREKIINLLHVPKHALSLQATGSLGSQEHKQALKYFWQSTIKSLHKKFVQALNEILEPELMGAIIDYDYRDVEILKDDLLEKADLATKMLTTKTINEIRQEIWELEPLAGGDALPSQGMQPAPQQAFQFAAPPSPPAFQLEPGQKIFPEKHKLFPELKAKHDDIIFKQGENTYNEFLKFTEEFLIQQAQVAVKILKGEKAKFDEEAFRKRLLKELLENEDAYQEGFVETLQPNLSRGYESQLALVFKAENREAIAALRARTASGEVAILKARALDTFAHLSETTTKKISTIVAESYAAGLSVNDITNNLIDKVSQLTPARARTIARTETLTAVSIGQAGALKNAQRVMPDAVKVWITADDERVRGRPGGLYEDASDDHWALHGTAVKINEKFANGLSHPRDVTGAPGQIINCRCSSSIISKEDLADFGV
jgi:HK97 family phage portal protein